MFSSGKVCSLGQLLSVSDSSLSAFSSILTCGSFRRRSQLSWSSESLKSFLALKSISLAITLSMSNDGLMTEYCFGGKLVSELLALGCPEVDPPPAPVLAKDVPCPSGVACSMIGRSIAAIGEASTLSGKSRICWGMLPTPKKRAKDALKLLQLCLKRSYRLPWNLQWRNTAS